MVGDGDSIGDEEEDEFSDDEDEDDALYFGHQEIQRKLGTKPRCEARTFGRLLL